MKQQELYEIHEYVRRCVADKHGHILTATDEEVANERFTVDEVVDMIATYLAYHDSRKVSEIGSFIEEQIFGSYRKEDENE